MATASRRGKKKRNRQARPAVTAGAEDGGGGTEEVPLRVRRSQRRRQEILQAAARAFRRDGFHEATLDGIAEELLVTKGSLYYYFENKEAILLALHERALEQAMAGLDQALTEQPTATGRLGRIIEGHLQVIFEELQSSGLVLDLSGLSPEHHQAISARWKDYEIRLRGIIEDGVQSGEFVPCQPELVTAAILGSINWVARWYDPAEGSAPHAIARQFSDFLVRGLACERRGTYCPLGLKSRFDTEGPSC